MNGLLACVLAGLLLAIPSTPSGAVGTPADAMRSASAQPCSAFDRSLELQGILFHVTSANTGSINLLHIVATGPDTDFAPVVRTIEGTVTGAEVADLNGDGIPEIYVYVTSSGSGSYGSLEAFSVSSRTSLSEIHLPAFTHPKWASRGYLGHDVFHVAGNVLVRRFPIYRDTDVNARPTGGTRELQYTLVGDESGWVLSLSKLIEY